MAATTKLVVSAAHEEFPECDPCQLTVGRRELGSLELLVVAGDYFNSDFAHLSMKLVWLRFFKFQRADLSCLSLQKLRVLELYAASSFLQLWENVEPPKELREMIITAAEGNSFDRFPSKLSGLHNLKKIALISCTGQEFLFETLPDEICDLQSLEYLELRYCTKLSILPARFGDLRNLRHLDLFSCKELVMLPESFQRLSQLKYLDLSHCKRLGTQEDFMDKITQITELQKLYLSGHVALQRLPHRITNQTFLRELQLQGTNLQDLPNDIGQLNKLEMLTIGSSSLTRLPDSLGNLSSLKSLSIIDCTALESLPKTLGHLQFLEYLCIEATEVRSLPEGFRQLANLRTLKISDCPLAELDFGSVPSFPLEKLTVINLNETLVNRISISEYCCPRLETLRLSNNEHLEEIEILPGTVNNIELSECEKLKNIKGIAALSIIANSAN